MNIIDERDDVTKEMLSEIIARRGSSKLKCTCFSTHPVLHAATCDIVTEPTRLQQLRHTEKLLIASTNQVDDLKKLLKEVLAVLNPGINEQGYWHNEAAHAFRKVRPLIEKALK
jgi:hypothetical protein